MKIYVNTKAILRQIICHCDICGKQGANPVDYEQGMVGLCDYTCHNRFTVFFDKIPVHVYSRMLVTGIWNDNENTNRQVLLQYEHCYNDWYDKAYIIFACPFCVRYLLENYGDSIRNANSIINSSSILTAKEFNRKM